MRVMLVVVVLLAACAATPPPAPFTAPKWTRQSVPTLPYERLHTISGAAGWNGGFVVAGGYFLPPRPNVVENHREVPLPHVSLDGETWREMPAQDIQSFVLGSAAAGFGDRGYVLGNNDHEGPVLLTLEGDAWTRLRLPGANAGDEAMSMAAGPRGVVVVALAKLRAFVPKPAKIWYSADGRTFSGPASVSDRPITDKDAVCLAATERGFLLPVSTTDRGYRPQPIRLYESVDGRDWTATEGEFPEPQPGRDITVLRAVQHNNGVTVAFGTMEGDADSDHLPVPVAVRRRDGETAWTRVELDSGRLPDVGVVPANRREVFEVFRWQTGFIAVGRTEQISAVWTSPDGLSWDKMPVRDNGFEAVRTLQFVTNGRTGLLVRAAPSSKHTGPAEIWRAGP